MPQSIFKLVASFPEFAILHIPFDVAGCSSGLSVRSTNKGRCEYPKCKSHHGAPPDDPVPRFFTSQPEFAVLPAPFAVAGPVFGQLTLFDMPVGGAAGDSHP
jgi:hypothetical protein